MCAKVRQTREHRTKQKTVKYMTKEYVHLALLAVAGLLIGVAFAGYRSNAASAPASAA